MAGDKDEGFVIRDRRGGGAAEKTSSPAAPPSPEPSRTASSEPSQGSGMPVTFASFVISLGSSSLMLMGE
ncbi:MAG TPA: hypothetical protein VIU63_03535, partial [Nitrospira sp.]